MKLNSLALAVALCLQPVFAAEAIHLVISENSDRSRVTNGMAYYKDMNHGTGALPDDYTDVDGGGLVTFEGNAIRGTY